MTETTLASLLSPVAPTWCAGCGNFSILTAVKQALVELQLAQEEVTIVFGIGCSGNTADFIKCQGLHSLHGRALANAVGIKLANHRQKVIVIGGDGDLYGEGLNHLLEACRGNHDVTALVFNNHRYSLTTGQTSPTSAKGTIGKSTPQGVLEIPFEALGTAVMNGAGFVARAYAGRLPAMTELVKQAISYEGFALVDVLQPCPTFNKEQDYAWYQEHIIDLPATHDPSRKDQAIMMALDQANLHCGLLYLDQNTPAYHQALPVLQEKTLVEQFPMEATLEKVVAEFV
jgi:2-oxoglutarate ferredoxin oxidoreductase subunit beta